MIYTYGEIFDMSTGDNLGSVASREEAAKELARLWYERSGANLVVVRAGDADEPMEMPFMISEEEPVLWHSSNGRWETDEDLFPDLPQSVRFEGRLWSLVSTGAGCTGYQHTLPDGRSLLITNGDMEAPWPGSSGVVTCYNQAGKLIDEYGRYIDEFDVLPRKITFKLDQEA